MAARIVAATVIAVGVVIGHELRVTVVEEAASGVNPWSVAASLVGVVSASAVLTVDLEGGCSPCTALVAYTLIT